MTTTLLLNASYEPLRVIPARKAVMLVLKEKAEVIHEGDGEFRSAYTSIRTPSVIRLTYMVKIPYQAEITLSRRAVLARDGGVCQYCGNAGDEIDHVHPRAKGGQHIWTNVVAACRPCNGTKGDRLLSELGWKLMSKPYAPRDRTFLILAVARRDEMWEPYLTPARAAFA